MGIYTGTDANDTITPDSLSAGVIAAPPGTTPGAGPDALTGNGGDDLLDGGAGADTLSGGTGNDTYLVDDAGDVVTEDDVTATGGEDVVLSSISYTLGAGLENLTLQGAAAIDGTGNESDNTLIGNSADNVLKGLGGADTLIGRGGNDSLIGGAGLDLLKGGGGDDTLKGGTDDDMLQGLGGSDTLKGNAGNDTLDGGKGVDTLLGGGGDDQFIFAKPNQGGDLIRDFRDQDGNADSIVVEAAGFKGGLVAGVVSEEQFQTGEGHDADNGDVRFIFDTSDNTLWFDKNGDGAGGLKLIADLQASANLEADNIFLV